MTTSAADPLEFFHQALQPGHVPELLKAAAGKFWLNQDHVLDCMESLSRGWFDRRHAGTRAAQEAAARMCAAQSPLDALHEYSQWANGALGRLVADASAVQQYVTVVGAAMLEPVSSPIGVSKASANAMVNDAAA